MHSHLIKEIEKNPRAKIYKLFKKVKNFFLLKKTISRGEEGCPCNGISGLPLAPPFLLLLQIYSMIVFLFFTLASPLKTKYRNVAEA